MKKQTKKVIVLGCERSGSTWITNVFDSDMNTICYLEPFADYASIFMGFPHRLFYLKNNFDPNFISSVQQRLGNLYSLKYAFYYKPGRSKLKYKINSIFIAFLDLLVKYFKFSIRKKVQYELLNLNNFGKNIIKNDAKRSTVEVLKELRLNFKIALLKQLFPSAKYIVAIRNPALQIQSILQMFDKGHLGELKRSIDLFHNYICEQGRFSVYHKGLVNFSDWPMDKKITAYWIINYNTLFEDLEKYNIDYQVITNEEMSKNPQVLVSEMLKFCNIPTHDNYKNYVGFSSKKGNLNQPVSPVNTRRNSAKHYKESQGVYETSNWKTFIQNSKSFNLHSKIVDIYSIPIHH